MQFRCYTCGHVFHDGPPTLAELSDAQARVVLAGTDPHGPVRETHAVQLLLMTTQFDGMTPHHFCDDCLLAIVDNPAAFVAGGHPEARAHTLEQQRNGNGPTDGSTVWCSCGTTYGTDVSLAKNAGQTWVDVNRLKMRHLSDTLTLEVSV